MATLSEKQPAQTPRRANDRRSQRVALRVPVMLMGHNADGSLFSEQAVTLVVNAHGALIALGAKVAAGQTVTIVNLTSGEERDCRVVRNGPPHDGKIEVAIEFAVPSPLFWKIAFPPDWGTRP
jgi:hypothetical protein